jgi:cytidylate kinase
MPAITISAGYGAGGSVVAPAVAERLGVPLLDRAISSRIADQLHVSTDEAREGAVRRSLVERFFGVLAPLAGGVTGVGDEILSDAPLPMDDASEFRARAEAIMREHLPTGMVVLGRAGAAALHGEPQVLTVRLHGSSAARIAQATRVEGVDADTAARRLPEVDEARAHYVRRLYGVDIDDPQLFDLQLDSTVLPLDACVDVIVTAYRALIGEPDQSAPEPSGA